MTAPQAARPTTASLLDVSPVIPVVVVEDVANAVPLARALLAGGVGIIEVTLRSPAALGAIAAIAREVPDMLIGAGTVCSAQQAEESAAAGARFLVSPGSTDRLLDGLERVGLPFLAGCATPSDVMRLVERGLTEAKLFPATVVGGTAMLKAVAGPLPQVRFCPTGGVTPETAPEFLALPNVGCVGGTWLTPRESVKNADWQQITALAAATQTLRPTG